MNQLLLLILVLFSGHATCLSQGLSSTSRDRIDSVLAEWQTDQGPGCSVAITRNDSVIYRNGFGLANLEDAVPNSPQSVYYLASLAKQFTGYSIALLIRDRKINPDEDIRVYLPWLPDYGKKISVKNLLYHTSGLRDYFTLLPFVGFSLAGELSQQRALSLIKKQRTLNFPPGEKFAYSNTNYMLLAEIIAQISGKSLAAFTDSAIFRPLRMTNTRFVTSATEIIKNRVNSYAGEAGLYGNVKHYIYTQGDGGLFSTATDLANWMRHLYQPSGKDSALVGLFTTPGQLNNGRSLAYAMGIIPDQDGPYRRLMHKGALAGYKNFMAIYPDDRIGIVILTNRDDGPKTNRAMAAIRQLLLPAPPTAKTDTARAKTLVIPEGLAGEYLARNGSRIRIRLKDGNLMANEQVLLPLSEHRFQSVANPPMRYHFRTVGKVYHLALEKSEPNAAVVYRVIPTAEKAALKDFIGTYSTTELDFTFTIALRQGRLWLSNHRHGEVPLTPLGKDDLFTELFFLDHLHAIRDRKGQLIALEYASGDNAGLMFNRMEKD